MAKRDPKASGKAFLDRLLAAVPEDQRAGVAAALGASEAVITTLGEGVLAQDDYSRSMDEARKVQQAAEQAQAEAVALQAKSQEWYGAQMGHLNRYAQLIREGYVDQATGQLTAKGRKAAKAGTLPEGDEDLDNGDPNTRTPPVDLTGFIKADQLPQLLQQHLASVVADLGGYAAAIPTLVIRHQSEFGGEILDTAALNKFCTERRLDLMTGYDQFVAGKRTEALTAKHQAEIEEARKKTAEETRAAVLAELRTQLPHPVPGLGMGGEIEIGVLDLPIPAAKPAGGGAGNGVVDPHTPQAAAAAYLAALQGTGAAAH